MSVAAAANAIVSWTEYKAALGVDDDSEQDKYQVLINQASSRIELFCGRKLVATDYTTTAALILDGEGTATMVVPHRPVNSITKLYVDSSRVFGADTEIAASRYRLKSAEGIIVLFDSYFPELTACVKLECNAGYATTSPEWQVLQAACLELVRWMSARMAGAVGKRSETNADGMSVGYEIDMPMNVRSMLEPFVETRV